MHWATRVGRLTITTFMGERIADWQLWGVWFNSSWFVGVTRANRGEGDDE